MKRTTLFTLTLLAAATAMITASCSTVTQEEKKVVGKYHLLESEEDEDENYAMSLEGTVEYKSDNTSTITATIKWMYDGDYDTYTFEYALNAEGTWAVIDGYLVEKHTECDIDFVGAKAASDDEESDYVIETMKQYFDVMLPEMKQELLGESRSKIVRITDSELVIRDEDDEETTFTRM